MASAVLLNGASSAGKTTLAKAIQEEADRVFLRISLDDFISVVPVGRENDATWFPVSRIERPGEPLTRIETGESGRKLLAAMRRFARDLADCGFSLVVDDVCTAADIDAWRAAMGPHPLLVVKVDAPADVLAGREAARGDRMIGLAREQASRIHAGVTYDLSVDSYATNVRQSATAVLEAVKQKGRSGDSQL